MRIYLKAINSPIKIRTKRAMMTNARALLLRCIKKLGVSGALTSFSHLVRSRVYLVMEVTMVGLVPCGGREFCMVNCCCKTWEVCRRSFILLILREMYFRSLLICSISISVPRCEEVVTEVIRVWVFCLEFSSRRFFLCTKNSCMEKSQSCMTLKFSWSSRILFLVFTLTPLSS